MAIERLRHWAFAAALALAVVLVYWPGRGGGFAFDDFPNIVDNTGVHVTRLAWPDWLAAAWSSPSSDLKRPLATLSFAANHYLSGLDPVPMKVTNIAIHALNALLALGLLRRLLTVAGATPARQAWAARFAGAAWALHPINLMAVLLVVQRMESLSHTFVLAGLWAYLAGRMRVQAGEARGWPILLAGLVGGTALGTLAKESAVLLPVYAACLELCVLGFRGPDGGRDRRLLALYAIVLLLPALVAVAWLLPRSLSPQAFAFRDFSLVERLLTEPRVLLDYVRWTLFPELDRLSLYHDDYVVSRGPFVPWTTLPAFLGLAGLLALAGWLRHRRPLFALGLLWFLGAHLLTATFLPLELVYEHRNYFASLGLCLALADLLLLAPRREEFRRIGAAISMLAVLGFAATTHLRAREWSDPLRFASTEAAKHPQSPRATYALGRILVVMSGYRADSPFVPAARAALERSRALPGSGVLPHGALLMLASRTGGAIERELWMQMRERLLQRPPGPQEVNALGTLQLCARDHGCDFPRDEMVATFEAALANRPNADVLAIYGDYTLNVLHEPARALAMWTQAMELRPREPSFRANVVKLLVAMGRHDEARAQIALLRSQGLPGQNDALAAALEARFPAHQHPAASVGPPAP